MAVKIEDAGGGAGTSEAASWDRKPDPTLLTLTMIVKNEARTIAKTLESVRPWIDRWCILDTGSTDGTQDVIRESLKTVPGSIFEEPFIDFATTRNHGLWLCGTDTKYILWLDADDVLQKGDSLREGLSSGEDAYFVRIEIPGAAFDSTRIVRSEAGWRFVGAVHEVLMRPDSPPPKTRIAEARILHYDDADSGARSVARWHRDVKILENEIKKDPQNTRATFYLGMTLHWLGRYSEAIRVLSKRIAMDGWHEELFSAKLTKARASESAKRPWSEVMQLYLDAYTHSPHRAEPLYAIAAHYAAEDNHALAVLFAKRADELPIPTQDTLFLEEKIYKHFAADLVGTHAYYLGEHELGERATRKALETDPENERLLRNLKFYTDRK